MCEWVLRLLEQTSCLVEDGVVSQPKITPEYVDEDALLGRHVCVGRRRQRARPDGDVLSSLLGDGSL